VLDLKTLQDWVLQRRFRAVPGVIDVIGWGGKTKTFELQVDFNKLMAYGLTLPQLLQAVENSNINVGGSRSSRKPTRRRHSALVARAWGFPLHPSRGSGKATRHEGATSSRKRGRRQRASLDHLVGEGEQLVWHLHAKRPRGFAIDH
jgi:AcrB/AcrD/AcrF family